jgi:hypothetical protein
MFRYDKYLNRIFDEFVSMFTCYLNGRKYKPFEMAFLMSV